MNESTKIMIATILSTEGVFVKKQEVTTPEHMLEIANGFNELATALEESRAEFQSLKSEYESKCSELVKVKGQLHSLETRRSQHNLRRAKRYARSMLAKDRGKAESWVKGDTINP